MLTNSSALGIFSSAPFPFPFPCSSHAEPGPRSVGDPLFGSHDVTGINLTRLPASAYAGHGSFHALVSRRHRQHVALCWEMLVDPGIDFEHVLTVPRAKAKGVGGFGPGRGRRMRGSPKRKYWRMRGCLARTIPTSCLDFTSLPLNWHALNRRPKLQHAERRSLVWQHGGPFVFPVIAARLPFLESRVEAWSECECGQR